VPYGHVVCTRPQERRALVRRPQKALDAIVRRAAAHALIPLAAAPHDVGGRIGSLWGLHPWPRTLAYQPPVHCLVPAGGLSADRTEWRPARPSSLVPVQARSPLVRGVLLTLLGQARPDLTRPEAVWTPGGWSTAHPPCQAQRQSCRPWVGTSTGWR
jgi:Putative transposase